MIVQIGDKIAKKILSLLESFGTKTNKKTNFLNCMLSLVYIQYKLVPNVTVERSTINFLLTLSPIFGYFINFINCICIN